MKIPPASVNQRNASIDYIQLTDGPVLCICPYCQSKVMTKVCENWDFKNKAWYHIPWCCFKYIEHRCPICNLVIGTKY